MVELAKGEMENIITNTGFRKFVPCVLVPFLSN